MSIFKHGDKLYRNNQQAVKEIIPIKLLFCGKLPFKALISKIRYDNYYGYHSYFTLFENSVFILHRLILLGKTFCIFGH